MFSRHMIVNVGVDRQGDRMCYGLDLAPMRDVADAYAYKEEPR